MKEIPQLSSKLALVRVLQRMLRKKNAEEPGKLYKHIRADKSHLFKCLFLSNRLAGRYDIFCYKSFSAGAVGD